MQRLTRFVLAFAVLGSATTASAQSSGTFNPTGNLITARSEHTATLLPDGTVLVTGGARWTLQPDPSARDCYTIDVGCLLASAELYDPVLGMFTSTGRMKTPRRMHTATALADGRILVAGGWGISGPVASAELYDPSTGTFTPTGDMMTARGGHSAILLLDGRVLIVGGEGAGAFPDVPPAELYDPLSGKFSAAGAYVARGGCDFCAPAILLADGTVLFPGQYPAQRYDPAADSFSAAGMPIADGHTAATILMNGLVLFAGGESDELGRMSIAELYNPATGSFTATGSMMSGRAGHTLNLLPNGAVLATGGETDACGRYFCGFAGSVASAELYDPSTATFAATGSMTAAREVHTATLLRDGRVLVAGGVVYGGINLFGGSLATAEVYTPTVLVPAASLVSVFHAGTSHLAAPDDPAVAGEDLDINCTGLSLDSAILPQVAIGGRMAAVQSLTMEPGVPGAIQVRVRVPAGIAPGPAVPVRLTYLDRPSNVVTIAVRGKD